MRAPCRKTTCTSFSSRSRRPGAAAAARRRCAHRARPPRRPRRVPQPMAAAAAEGAGADGKRSPPAGSGERQGPGGGLQLPEGAAPDGGSRREQARGAGRGPGEGRGRGGAARPGPAPPGQVGVAAAPAPAEAAGVAASSGWAALSARRQPRRRRFSLSLFVLFSVGKRPGGRSLRADCLAASVRLPGRQKAFWAGVSPPFQLFPPP